eukprot:71064_1
MTHPATAIQDVILNSPRLPHSTESPRNTYEQNEVDLLCSLVESEQLGPAIKTVFDRKLQGSYSKILQNHVKQTDKEIKDICANHYENFIGSVDNLITLKTNMVALRVEIQQLNDNIQDSGMAVMDKGQELMDHRYMRRNLIRMVEIVENCQFLTGLAAKAMEHIESKKFALALKTMNQLQRHQQSSVLDYQFAKQLERQIPFMYLKITNTVKREFKEWLTRADDNARALGVHAMCQIERQWQKERELIPSVARNYDRVSEEKEENKLRVESDMKKEDASEKVAFDYGPVYQCLNICESMNIAEGFCDEYKQSRKIQLTKMLDLRSSDGLINVQGYFAQLAGFFYIEDNIVKSGNQLMTRGDVQILWENALAKIRSVLKSQIDKVSDPKAHLAIKETITLFRTALEASGLFVRPLMEFIYTTREKFENLLLQRIEMRVREILSRETYEAMKIKDVEEYRRKVQRYGLKVAGQDLQHGLSGSTTISSIQSGVRQSGIGSISESHGSTISIDEKSDVEGIPSGPGEGEELGFIFVDDEEVEDEVESLRFPLTVPFSCSVPKICDEMTTFVSDYRAFARHLPEMNEAMRRAVERALVHGVDGSLNAIIDGTSRPIGIYQAAQLASNCLYLGTSCGFFRDLLEEETRLVDGQPVQLGMAKEHFLRSRTRCEDLIFELVNHKIDDFLSLYWSVDWSPSSPNKECNAFVEDLIQYAETTFQCLTFMPSAMKEAVHFTTFKHISNEIMQLLTSELKKFNIIGIHNLGLDVRILETYAARCNIANLSDTLGELRQFVDLFISGDLPHFANPEVRQTKYPFLAVYKVIGIIDKFKNLSVFGSCPEGIPNVKRKDVDVLIKRLRAE